MSVDNKSESPQSVSINIHVESWVREMAQLTKPDQIVWINGSEAEKDQLTERAVKDGTLLPLNQEARPGCYLHRSNPNDVARVEHLTFICTETKEQAGPTNNWMAPDEAYHKLSKLFDGSMKGRTMYVVPYLMGIPESPFSKIGVEVTDSVYVVLSMRIMARIGSLALEELGDSDDFNRGLHCTHELDPDQRFICHFPQDNTIWSIGSGYGGNVLLGKKCLGLRIASFLGKQEGWMAEHMLILGVENPRGERHYVAAAFPSACGKTNFAMMIPPMQYQGWKVVTVGDDIAWLRVGQDGRLWAVNPEAGYFGVAPGTSVDTNPNAMATISQNTLFTNVAMTSDRNVWWEGINGAAPGSLTDWQGRAWTEGANGTAAHPNSRFTAPMVNNPVLCKCVNNPSGVPISAIVFGGRRTTTVPLVMQGFDWTHGVFLGATMGSETTAAATGQVGMVRRDPMAMLPFCGYDMGNYLDHWLSMEQRLTNPPAIFQVNWFRRDENGKFLWPGFGENMRVLEWILNRASGQVEAEKTSLGWLPRLNELNLDGLNMPNQDLQEITAINAEAWRAEFDSQEDLFSRLDRTMPEALKRQRAELRRSL